MDVPIIPLIMCGGAGTRLWPASRENRPKQFLPLFGPRSTFQDTVLRLGNPALFERPIVVTGRDYRFLVADQLLEIGAGADILLEPCRRDSAPAIIAGTHRALQRDKACVVLVVAADHVIKDVALFEQACRSGREAAQHGRIVTFGVTPRRVATEFGYISPGAPTEDGLARVVERFTEKPDAETAERFIREGYLWNSGNFMFRPEDMLAEYAAFEPQSAGLVASAVEHATTDLDFVSVEPEAYAQARAESIDYAVLERTRRAAVVPVA
ncbi:MAG: mannose-1-phosphate guanylyltransferase, partial [Variibacter sp.]|nr:mannose-1-phosphate guanylyltransferase [Variibacter sp.]